MTAYAKSWKEDWHWFALLAITFLVNVPMLSPAVLFANDTLHALIFFHFAYADFIVHHEVPRWIPYLGYGTSFDFNLFNTIQPTDYVMMLAGWLCGCRDSLLLFKLSLILSQGALILGLYLLARRFFTSMLTVWLVCLGGLLTTSWMFCCPWGLTAYYLLPLELWFVLRFLDTKNPVHLWLAGLTEGVSLLGTVPYIAPLHLFVVVAFLVPFLCRQPGLSLIWRNFIHPLFFVCLAYFVLLGTWVSGIDAVWTAPGRDIATGNVPLKTFLGKNPADASQQSLAVMLRVLLKGDLYYGDLTNYIGILPLAAIGYALLRRRDTLFLSIAIVVLALLWLSLGGWFSTLIYYCFPMMKKYRFISAAWNFLRIFLLLLGGFGFDQLLRDLRGVAPPAPSAFSTRARQVIVIVLACFALDHLVSGDVKFFTSPEFWFQNRSWPELFKGQAFSFLHQDRLNELNREIFNERYMVDPGPQNRLEQLTAERDKLLVENQIVLMVRFLLTAAALAILWFLLVRQRSTRATTTPYGWVRLAGPLLLIIYLADVGFFYSQVVKHSPWCPSGISSASAFEVGEMIYRPRRYDYETKPDDARAIWDTIAYPRGGSLEQGIYASSFVLMQLDYAAPFWRPNVTVGPELVFRLDLMMPGIKKMIDARSAENEPLFMVLKHDIPFKRSLGFGLDKARMIPERDAIFAETEQQAIARFRSLPDPDRKIVIQGKRPATAEEDSGEQPSGKVVATQFSANRVVFKLPAGSSGWLFYADCYDPAWKAVVDAQPAQVYRANVGFKAVHVPQGAGEVTFYYDGGWRDLHGLVFVIASTLLASGLTVLLLAAPWVLKIPIELAPAPSAINLEWARSWSAFAWLALLVGGFFLFTDTCLTLLVVPLAAAVWIVHNRHRPASTGPR